MARVTSIPVDVREAILTFLNEAERSAEPLAMSEAINAIRRIFPDLEASDVDLIEAITSEAVASNVRLSVDVPRPDSSGALERWDNEGGAIKKTLTKPEQREMRRRTVNDTNGTRRRDRETQARNRLI